MDILNINNYKLLLFTIFFISCNKMERVSKIPLYHFNEKIKFQGYTQNDILSAKIIFIKKEKKLEGKIIFSKENDSVFYGRIQFSSIYDTIYKKDTIRLIINNDVHCFSKITQIYLNNSRPIFIEYFLDGEKYMGGEGVLSKRIR